MHWADQDIQPGDQLIVDKIYSSTIEPDRFFLLMNAWNRRMSEAGFSNDSFALLGSEVFKSHVERANGFLDQIAPRESKSEAQEAVAHIQTAAMVLSASGGIVAANRAAEAAFGIAAGSALNNLPFKPEGLQQFAASAGKVANSNGGQQEILHLREGASGKSVLIHLGSFRPGNGQRQVFAVSTAYSWPAELAALLKRAFSLTPAEVNVLKLLMSGDTVAEIAAATERSEATIRSQLHSLFAKTGAKTQAEMVRLTITLLTSMARDPERAVGEEPVVSAGVNPFETLILPDGRRMDFLRLGRPNGLPFLWLHGPLASCRLPRPAEEALDVLGLTMVVPVKAGYGYGSPLPAGKVAAEVWEADIHHLRRHLGIGSGPVVCNSIDFHLAVALGRADPANVTRILGINAGFPVTTAEEYARHSKLARFFRANARFAPQALPYLAKAIHGLVRLKGIESYARSVFTKPPADAAAFSDPDIRAAVVAGAEIIFGERVRPYDAFTADLVAVHRDWQPDFNGLEVPVTLVHGELDPNHSYETARDYCRRYPHWRFIGFPGQGHLAPLVHWRDILRLIVADMPGAGPAAEILDNL